MDPLTAFSVAGTVIQFVDFSSKLLLGAHGLYKSTSGVLTANQELELVTNDLRGAIRKLGILATQSGPGQDEEDRKLHRNSRWGDSISYRAHDQARTAEGQGRLERTSKGMGQSVQSC